MVGMGAGGPAGRAAGYGAGGIPGNRLLAARESGLRLGIPGGANSEFGVGRAALGVGVGGVGVGGNFLSRHPKFLEEYPPAHLLADEFIDTTDAPVEYLCPISTTLMADPVIAADGFSYERANIEGWIRSMKRNGLFFRSPTTDEPLEHVNLIPNQVGQCRQPATGNTYHRIALSHILALPFSTIFSLPFSHILLSHPTQPNKLHRISVC